MQSGYSHVHEAAGGVLLRLVKGVFLLALMFRQRCPGRGISTSLLYLMDILQAL
jgi:hypothetical protein